MFVADACFVIVVQANTYAQLARMASLIHVNRSQAFTLLNGIR